MSQGLIRKCKRSKTSATKEKRPEVLMRFIVANVDSVWVPIKPTLTCFSKMGLTRATK